MLKSALRGDFVLGEVIEGVIPGRHIISDIFVRQVVTSREDRRC